MTLQYLQSKISDAIAFANSWLTEWLRLNDSATNRTSASQGYVQQSYDIAAVVSDDESETFYEKFQENLYSPVIWLTVLIIFLAAVNPSLFFQSLLTFYMGWAYAFSIALIPLPFLAVSVLSIGMYYYKDNYKKYLEALGSKFAGMRYSKSEVTRFFAELATEIYRSVEKFLRIYERILNEKNQQNSTGINSIQMTDNELTYDANELIYDANELTDDAIVKNLSFVILIGLGIAALVGGALTLNASFAATSLFITLLGQAASYYYGLGLLGLGQSLMIFLLSSSGLALLGSGIESYRFRSERQVATLLNENSLFGKMVELFSDSVLKLTIFSIAYTLQEKVEPILKDIFGNSLANVASNSLMPLILAPLALSSLVYDVVSYFATGFADILCDRILPAFELQPTRERGFDSRFLSGEDTQMNFRYDEMRTNSAPLTFSRYSMPEKEPDNWGRKNIHSRDFKPGTAHHLFFSVAQPLVDYLLQPFDRGVNRPRRIRHSNLY